VARYPVERIGSGGSGAAERFKSVTERGVFSVDKLDRCKLAQGLRFSHTFNDLACGQNRELSTSGSVDNWPRRAV